MRLGFHYHVPAILDGEQIRMPAYQGRFVDALADHCSEIVCFLHSPVAAEQAQMDYALQKRNVRLVDLGPHASVPRRLLAARRCASVLRAERLRLDALLIRGPSPLLPTLASAVRPLPTVLLLVSDALAGVDDLPQARWRKEAIRLLWKWNHWGQMRVARRSLTFVNSRILFREMEHYVPHLVETRTTTLTAVDFFEREDTCLKPPFRLLYTGRMDRNKGLLEMVQVLGQLVAEGFDVVLDLVGQPIRNDDVLKCIEQLLPTLHIEGKVFYHGYKPLGPELFSLYRRADLFVIASTSDHEGFPRVVWEAMAQSLPVVASRVSSIPHFLAHLQNAYLIEPKDPVGLARAIKSLISDSSLRRRLIRNGLELARANTLDQRAADMVREIRLWLADPSCA